MNDVEKRVRQQLIEMQDLKYKEFQAKLIPNVDPDTIIGIRTPVMRKFAQEFCKTDDAKAFIKILPHRYFDENNLHSFLIEREKNFDQIISELNIFLPYVDNWATCDLMSPPVFKKHTSELIENIIIWLSSEHTYTKRFGIGMLLRYYLDENFKDEYPALLATIRSEEYYINMMIAWYFATALAKQYKSTLPYIENHALDIWTHNKTIQKAVESNRIDDETKKHLRTLKIKLK